MKRFAIPVMLSCTWLVACGDESTGSLKAQSLTRVEQQDDLEGCDDGGVTISSGVDTNKDGKLDDDEVTEEQVICSGGPGVVVPPGEEGGELTRVDILEAGDATCPAGGVAVHTGLDDDEDGLLSDDEIDETEHLCSPEADPTHAILSRTTDIAVGSVECVWGGKRLESGYDDGAGDGEPDDGLLHNAEVDTSYAVCNGRPPIVTEPTDPPAGAPGTFTIDVRGANSGTGPSGYGGSFYGGYYNGCLPAITKVFTTGATDATFTIPSITFDFGAERYDVTADATVAVLPTDVGMRTDGARYLDANASRIVRWNAANTSLVEVTGLSVAAGATLTVPVVSVNLNFAQDVDVAGRIALTDGATRSLSLQARNVRFGEASVVDLTGSTGDVSNIYISAQSTMSALGQLIVAGSDTTAHPGGQVQLYAGGRMYVGGTIDASGGDSAAGAAAGGGSIALNGGIGGVWTSATLKAFGGTGATLGGPGGDVYLGRDTSDGVPRELRNTGSVDVSGGSQTQTGCTGGPCNAGSGGEIGLFSQGADLRNSGALKSNGGTSFSGGGSGGTIRAAIHRLGNGGSQPRTRLSLSGDVHAKGGDGSGTAPAGSGGDVYFDNCGGSTSVTEFLGYQSLVISGGSSTTEGYDAGYAWISDEYSDTNTSRRLFFNVPIAGKGGDGAQAGDGGDLYARLSIFATVAEELPTEIPSVVLNGAHVLNGGTGIATGPGGGGSLDISARGTINMSGSADLSGGTSNVGGGFAGYVSVISVLGNIENHAALTANGGSSTMSDGAQGGCIDLQANGVSNDAALTARGGNGMAEGGDGGNIALTNITGTGTNTGTLDVAGGTGTTPGTVGLAGFGVAQCGNKRALEGASFSSN